MNAAARSSRAQRSVSGSGAAWSMHSIGTAAFRAAIPMSACQCARTSGVTSYIRVQATQLE